jgi:ubiquinone/menaquinone biosynthesis C-methylase UbiE
MARAGSSPGKSGLYPVLFGLKALKRRPAMLPKPLHLRAEYGAQFDDASIVDAYHFRPPYSAEAFDVLLGLVPGRSPSVLDLGCGTGEIARRIAPRSIRVDAVDPAQRMLMKAQSQPGGEADNIKWILGSAEEAPLHGPYDLVIAGASLHWMEWDIVLPRLAAALTSDGYLAILEQHQEPSPWSAQLVDLCHRISTNRHFQPYNIVEELTTRNLFEVNGNMETQPTTFTQSLPEYIESFHARNGFSRDRLSGPAAAEFDQRLAEMVTPHLTNNQVHLRVLDVITWGRPTVATA